MSTAYWCESAWLGGDTVDDAVLVTVDGGVIGAVEVGVQRPAGAVALHGVVLPGLANAHSHAFHRALRGRTQVGTGSFWTWREQMYAAASRLQPDTYHRLARATFAEMALAGVTCVGEFHYLHHDTGGRSYNDPNALGQSLVEAAAAAGIRITLLDTCYLHGGLSAEGDYLAPNEVQQRFSDGSVERWATRVEAAATLQGPHCRVGAAVHSVRAVDPTAIAAVASFSAERSMVLHTHLSEQPAENEQCHAAHGSTPTQVFADAGALGQSFSAVHATHLTDTDISLLGGARCTCCFCPTTERDLADGIGPAARLLAAGAGLSLGSDSHAVIDLLEEARAVELDERLATNVRGSHDAASLLRAATEAGHGSLGWHDAGRIAVGQRADLVAVSMESVRTAGTSAIARLATVVFAATAADVRSVVVDGRLVVDEGRHVSIDVVRELGSSIQEVFG
ncbi:MAG: formimidoylglutamate deiminase [Ilumatobacteraceae bacterium]